MSISRDAIISRTGIKPVRFAHPAARLWAPVMPGTRYVSEAWSVSPSNKWHVELAVIAPERLMAVRYSPELQCFEVAK